MNSILIEGNFSKARLFWWDISSYFVLFLLKIFVNSIDILLNTLRNSENIPFIEILFYFSPKEFKIVFFSISSQIN